MPAISNTPVVPTINPPTDISLYRPVREMIWPDSRLAPIIAIIMGVSTVPLCVALVPMTP